MEYLLLLLSSVYFFLLAASQRTTDPSEVEALRAFSKRWNLDIWDASQDPCTSPSLWSGENANPSVDCDCHSFPNGTCHVVGLKVYDLDVVGEIPMELFKLTELVDLNLSKNLLSGQVPPEIGRLSKLQNLSLGMNNLSGPVPPELGNLTGLIFLSLSSNRFTGLLPRELGNLTSLQQLYIDSSGVGGHIPDELANLKNLTFLWAFDSHFTGKLPAFIGNFTNLTDLRIYGTSLEGPIPESFSALRKLETLKLGDLLHEDSSLSFLKNMTSLSILSLRNSLVAGEVPDYLGEFSNLIYLDLSFNKLTGHIPNSFQRLNSLQHLYLGSNNLMGEVPFNIIKPNLTALDVSFNPITGSFPSNYSKKNLSMNFLETLINTEPFHDSKSLSIQYCLRPNSSCTSSTLPFVDSSFAINCGGGEIVSTSGIDFYGDSAALGAASFYVNTEHQWVVSNTGSYFSNPDDPNYVKTTDSAIMGTSDPELYKTARISPSSLKYYVAGLSNGKYTLELHFAEIVMNDFLSWKGQGRRLFDIYIQGEKVMQDFNILDEAQGSKTAIVKNFKVNVTNTIMEMHFFWAGKGTCCIPVQETYGPLVSAIYAYKDSSSRLRNDEKRRGVLVGITAVCMAGMLILSSIVYLWWKKTSIGQMQAHTNSPKEG